MTTHKTQANQLIRGDVIKVEDGWYPVVFVVHRLGPEWAHLQLENSVVIFYGDGVTKKAARAFANDEVVETQRIELLSMREEDAYEIHERLEYVRRQAQITDDDVRRIRRLMIQRPLTVLKEFDLLVGPRPGIDFTIADEIDADLAQLLLFVDKYAGLNERQKDAVHRMVEMVDPELAKRRLGGIITQRFLGGHYQRRENDLGVSR